MSWRADNEIAYNCYNYVSWDWGKEPFITESKANFG
jgi:hypothetical protein